MVSHADPGQEAAGSKKGGVEGGGPLPFLVWFSLQEQGSLGLRWAAYKAWCEFCLCKCSIKGTNLPAPGLLPPESFAYIFQMIIHSNQPPSPPPKADLLKKPPYMVILLTHRQLAFLGTLFKEDPPLGFYIALVFMPKPHQPSVTERRTSHTLGEYCTASAGSSFPGLPNPLGAGGASRLAWLL